MVMASQGSSNHLLELVVLVLGMLVALICYILCPFSNENGPLQQPLHIAGPDHSPFDPPVLNSANESHVLEQATDVSVNEADVHTDNMRRDIV